MNGNYDGICSDVPALSSVCRRFGVKMFVDEAHGALYGQHPALPLSALNNGAESVVNSFHKSAGSLTQSAVLHISKDSTIDPQHFYNGIHQLQTTSPLIFLFASMDAARAYLASDEGKDRVAMMVECSQRLKEQLANLRNVEVYIPDDPTSPHTQQDVTRFLIKVRGKTPKEVIRMCLDKYAIDPEKDTEKATMFSFLIGHEREDYDRLYKVLREIDQDANSWPELEDVPMRRLPDFPVVI